MPGFDIRTIPKLPLFSINSSYYLYDNFTTDLAAGAVNGTSAEPVGGARTVTDTNSKISIASGVLSFATGKAANDGVWYPIQTRVLGKSLLSTFNITVNSVEFGFDATQAGDVTDAIRFGGASNIQVKTSGTVITVGAWSATTYSLAVVQRASGIFYYIKGGAFTNWTLLYVSSAGTSSGYPAAVDTFGTAVCTFDNIRVPKQAYIPVPLQSDGMSAATTDGLGNPENNGTAGNVWTGATWGVAGGVASNTPTIEPSEKVTDGGLENWTSATNLTSWSEAVNGTSTVNQDTDAGDFHGGSSAARIDVDASGSSALFQQAIVNSAYQWVSVNWWGKSSASGKQLRTGSTSSAGVARDPGTTYTNYVDTFRLTSANESIIFTRQAGASASSSLYFDDISVKFLTLSTLFRTLTNSTPNVIADVNVTLTAGTQAGIVLNLDNATTPANFVIAYHDGTNCKLEKCVAGTYTTVITAAATYSAGATIRVIKDGTEYRLFYNNAAVGSAGTILDVGIVNNTLHGLFSTYSNNTFDNLVIWARGNEGQYAGLNNL